MANRTPIYIKADADGNIIKIARGSGIDLAGSGIDKGWHDVRNDPLVRFSQGIASKRFKLERGKLKVKDTHEIKNGKLIMKPKDKR